MKNNHTTSSSPLYSNYIILLITLLLLLLSSSCIIALDDSQQQQQKQLHKQYIQPQQSKQQQKIKILTNLDDDIGEDCKHDKRSQLLHNTQQKQQQQQQQRLRYEGNHKESQLKALEDYQLLQSQILAFEGEDIDHIKEYHAKNHNKRNANKNNKDDSNGSNDYNKNIDNIPANQRRLKERYHELTDQSSHKKKPNTPPVNTNQCNQNIIIGDWGFKELANGNQSVWNITAEDGFEDFFKVSYPTSMSDDYDIQTIIGYHAVCFESIYSMGEFYIWLNQTMTLPLMVSDTVAIFFTYASTRMIVEMTLYANGDNPISILHPSQSTFVQAQENVVLDYQIPTAGWKMPLSFKIKFSGETTFCLSNVYASRIGMLDESEIYVSTSGSDILGNGTIENPFSSIQQAIAYSTPSSTIYLATGTYCGQGNSWIDPIGKEITIAGLQRDDYPIISGMDQLIIFDYLLFNVSIKFSLENVIIEHPSMISSRSAVHISGLTKFSATNVIFRHLHTNNSIELDFMSESTFHNCSFYDYNSYAISFIGLFGLNKLSVVNCTFLGNLSINALNMDVMEIKDTLFISPNQFSECSMTINMAYSLLIQQSLLSHPICVYSSNLTVSDSIVYSKYWAPSVFLIQNSNSSFINVTFDYYEAQNYLLSFRGTLIISDSLHCSNITANFLQVETGTISVYNSTIANVLSNAIELSTSVCLLENTVISNIQAFMTASTSYIYLDSTHFMDIFLPSHIQDSNVYTSNCTYTRLLSSLWNMAGGSIQEQTGKVWKISDSFMILSQQAIAYIYYGDFSSYTGWNSFITLSDQSIVHVIGTNFSSFTAPHSAVFLVQDDCSAYIDTSQFTNCHAYSRGGVASTLDNGQITCTKCIFTSNKANQGGLFYMDYNTGVDITNSLAEYNYAHEGSIIYYTRSPPILVNFTMINNTQEVGTDIQLGSAVIYLNSSNDFTDPIVSGENYPFRFQIRTMDDQPLTNKFCQTKCMIYLYLSGQFLQSQPIDDEGYATFSNVTLIGKLGNTETLQVSSNEPQLHSTSVLINFQNCVAGYQPDTTNTQCLLCPSGTYGTTGNSCTLCPPHITCFGGSSYMNDVGYWIDENLSPPSAFQCPSGLCFTNFTCLDDYTGPLCAQCVDGYYNCGAGCKEQNGINGILITIKILFFTVLVLFQQLSNDSSGLVTIALYFLQTLAVISNGIKFSIIEALSGSGTTTHNSGHTSSPSIFTYLSNCIAPLDFFWNHYIIVMQPIILLFILLVVIIVEFILRRTGFLHKIPIIKRHINPHADEFVNRQFSAFIKVCMNSYGPFITEVLLILFCIEAGSYKLLNANPAVQCSGSEYDDATRVTFGLFPIILGFPLLVFILLFRSRKRMNEKNVIRRLGVFFLKYKDQFYFWDVFLLIKRLAIAALSLIQYDSPARSISLVVVTFGSLVLQLIYRPFLSDMDNNLETVSLTLLFISCIYLDNDLYLETEQYLLIISVVVFALAAVRFQGQYFLNEIRTFARPIIDKINSMVAGKKEAKRKRKNSSNKHNYKNFNYEENEEDDGADKKADVIGRVDRNRSAPSHYVTSSPSSPSSPLLRGGNTPSYSDRDEEDDEDYEDDDDDDDDDAGSYEQYSYNSSSNYSKKYML